MNDPRRLVLFAHVVEQGSFAGAARILRRDPSVVSAQIADLEAAVGVKLLHRTTRSLHLTDAGERLLPWAQQVLDAMRGAERELVDAGAVVAGPLRITCPEALLGSWVVPLVVELLERHPAIEIDLMAVDRPVSLEDGEADVAIRVGRLKRLALRTRRIGSFREWRVRRATHSTEGREGSNPERRVLLPWQTQGTRTGIAPLHVHSVATAVAAVEAGLGVAQLPEPAVAELVRNGALEVLEVKEEVSVHVLHAFGAKPPPQVVAFVELAANRYLLDRRGGA